METQEQILKEQRLRIEVLRHQLLLRYYELLLSLDVLAQAAEVKTLMGYINTLERYASDSGISPRSKEPGRKDGKSRPTRRRPMISTPKPLSLYPNTQRNSSI